MYTPKLFISCPMNGLTDEMIKVNREKMHKIAEIVFDKKLEVIPSYITPEGEVPEGAITPIWRLGRSIQLMSEADYYIGVNAFYDCDYRGCEIENNIAHNYGLRTYFVDVHVLSLPKKEIYYETPTNK